FFHKFNEAITDEEKFLYEKAKVDWLCDCDKNTTYFQKVVKSRISRNEVSSIKKVDGGCVEGTKIADEFVNHFEKFFGQAKNVQQLDSLGNIFSKSLTDDEVVAMVSDVSDHEIKSVMFSIDDYKSPGPDGYTTCFFKKAWSVRGNDVCLAIKEFFNSRKLLREINSTLITLIPKVHHPKAVTEFRPIACCNVLYKCICKVLTNRIKGSLNKLVNLNQSAFIQGRNIQDNILLTHELLKGYNRKGGSKRCALKINIAKAYDINVANSPVYKFHLGCKDFKMTHICFANDLLVICHGSMDSIKVIKESIEDFSRVSGLEPNLNKSTIFFRNVNAGDQRSILSVLPFSVGKFPIQYLGVPLITKRLGRGECKQLIDRVKNKVDDWKNKSLTYAGRMQLITSVLNSMQVYWALVFLLAKSTVKDIERILKGFLWCQERARHHIKYRVGNGRLISAWYDKWNKVGPLCQFIDTRDLYNARFDCKPSVADVIHNNQWIWKDELGMIIEKIIPMLTGKTLFGSLKAFLVIPLYCGWLFMKDYKLKIEFFSGIMMPVWRAVKAKGYINGLEQRWQDTVNSMASNHCNTIKSVVCKIVFSAVIYFHWQERNKRQFTKETRFVVVLSEIILDPIRARLSGLKVKNSINVQNVAKE
ncbi:RNA-directed DNA polymerase, eukaryota, reverse transcriptase zinc-binding domain protein, partial [Tanacetum coccineum]